MGVGQIGEHIDLDELLLNPVLFVSFTLLLFDVFKTKILLQPNGNFKSHNVTTRLCHTFILSQYYLFLSVDATEVVSKECPIIVEQVLLTFLTFKVTIATVLPVKTPLILALSAYNSETSLVTPICIMEL